MFSLARQVTKSANVADSIHEIVNKNEHLDWNGSATTQYNTVIVPRGKFAVTACTVSYMDAYAYNQTLNTEKEKYT